MLRAGTAARTYANDAAGYYGHDYNWGILRIRPLLANLAGTTADQLSPRLRELNPERGEFRQPYYAALCARWLSCSSSCYCFDTSQLLGYEVSLMQQVYTTCKHLRVRKENAIFHSIISVIIYFRR